MFFESAKWSVFFFYFISGYFSFKRLEKFELKNTASYILEKIIRIYSAYAVAIILAFILCNMQWNWNPALFESFDDTWENSVSISESIPHAILAKWFDTNLLNPPI